MKPTAWVPPPTEMSPSLLNELEDCPRKWALQHSFYPEIWPGHGYPPKIHMASLIGNISHSSIEKIIKELANGYCYSTHDSKAIEVMRSLGGYTNVINLYIQISIDALKNNPRAAWILDNVQSALFACKDDIRGKIQFILGRTSLDGALTTIKNDGENISGLNQQSALPYGIYSEVSMHVPRIRWRGRADLLIINDAKCELVDFKTGAYSEKHEFQMLVYALLWHQDSVLNPSLRSLTKLTLSYVQEDKQIPVPTEADLRLLESEIEKRAKKVLDSLSVSPPDPLPNIEKCRFCDVRHLCEAFWKMKINGIHNPSIPKNQLLDAEITIIKQNSPFSWSVEINGGPYLIPGITALMRVPSTHYVAHSAAQRDRLRVLDVNFIQDFTDETNLAVLTLNKFSEVYYLGTGF